MRREVKGLHRKVPESLQHTTPRCNTLQRNLCSAIIVFLGDLLRQRACIVESLQHTTHTTTHYNTLRHTAAHWNTLQRTAIQCNHGKIRDSPKAQISWLLGIEFCVFRHLDLARVTPCCSVFQCIAVCCSVLQCILSDVLQCVAVSEANNSSECLASN